MFAQWQELLSGRSEEQITASNPAGLSIKDTVAHLHAWQQLSIARLEAAKHGEWPIMPDWVTGPDPDDEALLEIFNARIQATTQGLAWPHVYAQWEDGFRRCLELAESISERDLMATSPYPWLGDYALSDVLAGLLEHHAEHLQSIIGAPSCLTCALVQRRDAGHAPLWDNIHRTAHWDLVHSYNTALPGWLVLVSRRHITAIDELTDAEAAELGVLLRRVSAALRQVTGCIKTYVAQFAEQAEHPHVHFHLIPRLANQPDDRRGPRVFAYLGVPNDQRVSDARMDAIAAEIRRFLMTK
jgi:diadenosine tetraphosphate (Ap4A) HIT family hydrolase